MLAGATRDALRRDGRMGIGAAQSQKYETSIMFRFTTQDS